MIEIDLKKTLQAAQSSMAFSLALKINKGHLVTLYGESGAGKTSTLRMLSGLLKPDAGEIKVFGETWFCSKQRRAGETSRS